MPAHRRLRAGVRQGRLTARTLANNLSVLRMVEDQSLNSHVVGIAMGEEGLISRVLSPRAGAAFTFASAADGAETAPGQVSARTLLDLYRLEQLDHATRIFAVAGNPISHSLSPLMHVTAFRRENLNAVMLPLKVKTLGDLLTVIRDLPLDGVAVTMPLKQEVLPHLANMDPLTAKIGACNTLRTGADGKLYGFNTDVAGVVRPLERRMNLKGARILVLGAGGAARAAVFGLVEQGAEVTIVNRTHEKAVALARKAKAHVLKQNALAKNRFDAIINTTPCGMTGIKQLPIEDELTHSSPVFDRRVDQVEDQRGVELALLDGELLLDAGHAAGRGVDNGVEAVFGERVLLEHVRLGLARQGDGLLVGAVDDGHFRALLHEAEDRGTRRAAGAEHENARPFEVHAPFQRPNHACYVGIEAIELAVCAGTEGVAGADLRGKRVHVGQMRQHFLLERHGNGNAVEGQVADDGEQVAERA